MKFLPISLAVALASGMTVSSCEDSASLIGSSLVSDSTAVIIDTVFTVSGETYRDNSVLSRTIVQLLGNINATEFGHMNSDFVTQFMPVSSIDTVGVHPEDVDSVNLMMFYLAGGFTGDSLVPMGLKVYPLTKQLSYPIYSDFDPASYYSESKCWTPVSRIYTANSLYYDTITTTDSYGNTTTTSINGKIQVPLPVEFGRNIIQKYRESPSTFSNPDAFAQFFPGIYVKSTFGSGRITNIEQTRINIFYKQHGTYTDSLGQLQDTLYSKGLTCMGVTPEIISNNIIDLSFSPFIKNMIDQGDKIIVAPTGYNVRLRLPALEIIDSYKRNAGDMAVVNSLTMILPVEQITNNYGIRPPENVLMILESDKDKFFNENMTTDNKTSFLATYNTVTSQYAFTGLRTYLLDLMKKSEPITEKDYTFLLLPVNVAHETSSDYYGQPVSYVTSITPYVSGPTMCKFNLDDVKITFTYSKQYINN